MPSMLHLLAWAGWSSVAQRSSNLMIRMPYIFSLTKNGKSIDRANNFHWHHRDEKKKAEMTIDYFSYILRHPFERHRPANHDRFFFAITMKMWWAFSNLYLYMPMKNFACTSFAIFPAAKYFFFASSKIKNESSAWICWFMIIALVDMLIHRSNKIYNVWARVFLTRIFHNQCNFQWIVFPMRQMHFYHARFLLILASYANKILWLSGFNIASFSSIFFLFRVYWTLFIFFSALIFDISCYE